MANLKGIGAVPGKAEGLARVVASKADLYSVEEGEVLVVKSTDEDSVLAINKAVAVVVEEPESRRALFGGP